MSVHYQYDLAGNLTTETYPSGRSLQFSYDIAGRQLTASGTLSSATTNYVQSAGYYPDGHSQYAQYGSNLWSWQSVDNLLRPWQAWALQNNDANKWSFIAYNGFSQSEDVVSQTEGFGPGVAWNNLNFLNDQWEYDGLHRLFKLTDTNYFRQYSFDEYGNLSLTQNSGVPLSGLTPFNNGSSPYNTSNNRLLSANYDGRGNITGLGAVSMNYDAEGNMKSTADSGTGQSINWIYDAAGQRVQKQVAGGATVVYVHDAYGQLAAEYNSAGVTPSCVTCYLTYDMIGTAQPKGRGFVPPIMLWLSRSARYRGVSLRWRLRVSPDFLVGQNLSIFNAPDGRRASVAGVGKQRTFFLVGVSRALRLRT